MELCRNIMADLAQTITSNAAEAQQSVLSRWKLPLLLLLATIAIRWPAFGDPNYHIDEGFYLLVGEQMQNGALPYLDIWDRKPVGLFLIYWAIAGFGDVYAYQIAAAISVWMTSWILSIIAERSGVEKYSFLVGVIYIISLGALAGGGGQSPIFYNLPVATAALLTLDVMLGHKHDPTRNGAIAMLLCGIAITIKQTAAVEGAFLGLVLVYNYWRQTGLALALRQAAILMVLGLLPTLIAILAFAALGNADMYLQATMETIFLTAPNSNVTNIGKIAWLVHIIAPFVLFSIFSLILSILRGQGSTKSRNFLIGWLLASSLGFIAVPNYFDHYALPLTAPLAVACGLLLTWQPVGIAVIILPSIWLLLVSGFPQTARTERSRIAFEQAVKSITSHLGNGCLFVYDAPSALYRASNSCLPTSRVFSEHLSNAREANAIGVDAVAETKAILRSKPSVIVFSTKPTVTTPNLETRELVKKSIRENYFPVSNHILEDVVGRTKIEVWVIKKAAQSSTPTPDT